MKNYLLGGNCADRTFINTGAAVDAKLGIDYKFPVAFGNRFRGTYAAAGSAGNAFIGYYVRHNNSLKMVKPLLNREKV